MTVCKAVVFSALLPFVLAENWGSDCHWSTNSPSLRRVLTQELEAQNGTSSRNQPGEDNPSEVTTEVDIADQQSAGTGGGETPVGGDNGLGMGYAYFAGLGGAVFLIFAVIVVSCWSKKQVRVGYRAFEARRRKKTPGVSAHNIRKDNSSLPQATSRESILKKSSTTSILKDTSIASLKTEQPSKKKVTIELPIDCTEPDPKRGPPRPPPAPRKMKSIPVSRSDSDLEQGNSALIEPEKGGEKVPPRPHVYPLQIMQGAAAQQARVAHQQPKKTIPNTVRPKLPKAYSIQPAGRKAAPPSVRGASGRSEKATSAPDVSSGSS